MKALPAKKMGVFGSKAKLVNGPDGHFRTFTISTKPSLGINAVKMFGPFFCPREFIVDPACQRPRSEFFWPWAPNFVGRKRVFEPDPAPDGMTPPAIGPWSGQSHEDGIRGSDRAFEF